MGHIFYFRAMLITLGLIALLRFFNTPLSLTYLLLLFAILLGFISYWKKGREVQE